MKKQPPSTSSSELLNSFVKEVVGLNGIKIIQSIGDGATDERIEEKTNIKIAEIRSILNHLHSYGIVEYTKEKNMQNGWFTYTWKVNTDRALRNFLFMKKKTYEELKRRVSSEEGFVYYICKKGCCEVVFDLAVENKFKCPECKRKLVPLNEEKELKKLEENIRAIEKIINTDRSIV